MNRDFIVPSGQGPEYITVTVNDVSGAGASLKAVYYKNGNARSERIIKAVEANGKDVAFGFIAISYSGPTSVWHVSPTVQKVFNAGVSSSYTGFKSPGEDIYYGNYKDNFGVTVCTTFIVKK